MLTRRQFLKAGVAAGVGLVLVRLAYGPFSKEPSVAPDAEFSYTVLDPSARTIVAALAPVLLDGALPAAGAQHAAALRAVVRGVDIAVAGLPPQVQAEVQQLFALLGFPLTRRWLAGIKPAWLQASNAEIERFLQAWRHSSLALLRSGYQALHQLVLAAWYGNPRSWPRIGYPGPPQLGQAKTPP